MFIAKRTKFFELNQNLGCFLLSKDVGKIVFIVLKLKFKYFYRITNNLWSRDKYNVEYPQKMVI